MFVEGEIWERILPRIYVPYSLPLKTAICYMGIGLCNLHTSYNSRSPTGGWASNPMASGITVYIWVSFYLFNLLPKQLLFAKLFFFINLSKFTGVVLF